MHKMQLQPSTLLYVTYNTPSLHLLGEADWPRLLTLNLDCRGMLSSGGWKSEMKALVWSGEGPRWGLQTAGYILPWWKGPTPLL